MVCNLHYKETTVFHSKRNSELSENAGINVSEDKFKRSLNRKCLYSRSPRLYY